MFRRPAASLRPRYERAGGGAGLLLRRRRTVDELRRNLAENICSILKQDPLKSGKSVILKIEPSVFKFGN